MIPKEVEQGLAVLVVLIVFICAFMFFGMVVAPLIKRCRKAKEEINQAGSGERQRSHAIQDQITL